MSLPLAENKKEQSQAHPDEDRLEQERLARLRDALGTRSLVLIGLMGAGKTSVGRRLANRLDLPFVDADSEIEAAAGERIEEIFAEYGEAYFRQGERKVIARLLQSGPQVLATGGGAYMNRQTREGIAQAGISIWLRAELPVLMKRVRRRTDRPLLASGDPEETMRKLMLERYPVYAEADLTVETRDAPHDTVVADIIAMLEQTLLPAAPGEDRAAPEEE
ncbi:shikimate kinase [Methyloligella sp. 2.7D]|nr:shikimate kinase [Methyloligella sp. GL2]